MERTFVSFRLSDLSLIRQQVLAWADKRFDTCCFLDNHHYTFPGHVVECLLAAGAAKSVRSAAGEALDKLAAFVADKKDWVFGHFGYGLSKETEPTGTVKEEADPSDKPKADPIGFPDLFFFVPQYVIELRPDDPGGTRTVASAGQLRIGSLKQDHERVFAEIEAEMPVRPGMDAQKIPDTIPAPIPRFTRDEYLATVGKLQQHILRGDCYEINFCQEFFSSPADIDPLQTWFSLSRSSPNPFSAYYKVGHSHLLCASPERYLKRSGKALISQPIKGTSPRRHYAGGPGLLSDDSARDRLYHSAKDRSENVMVVDLVRNDLSRVCTEGSVQVEELYGVYTFPQVHQMISTIKGELRPGLGLADCIRASFPMGSMTGAPKNRVVKLIAEVERTPRGIFSGAVGYMDPNGDFDLNVVIRSILYNARDKYLSYQVGSGITFYSDPSLEYEECLLKAGGMRLALGFERGNADDLAGEELLTS